MAHGFLQSFDKHLEVYSGGTEPAVQVNSKAMEMMKEVGIDISSHIPTHVNAYINQEWDYVITVCGDANESCPTFIGKVGKRLHIAFDDPSHATGTLEFIDSEFRLCVTKSEMPLPVSTLLKSEKKNCQNALAVATAKKDMEKEKKGIGFFERYLTVWVAICIVVGIAIGQWFPAIPETLGKFEYANVSIPVAILIWLMIYPMMMKVDFQSIKNVGKKPKGVFITCIVNWLIKPFTMFGIAWIFFFVIFKQWIPEALAGDILPEPYCWVLHPVQLWYLYGAILLKAMLPIRWYR